MSFNLGLLKYTKVINNEEYDVMYNTLKSKYGNNLIQNWTECTDPQKFVHEDLGIASYLLLLWKDQGVCKFVDLGCGNGLLVYLLTEEGHIGVGLDVRKRKIWSMYPPTTVLKEETVIPSASSVYPDADWLIGNHSDELTAWLPIMATRSNPTCQFFTIPCCPFKLNGAKYQRRNTKLSVYQDFLEYIQEVGELCGFSMIADKMRIPSTKRICLIGRRMQGSSSTLEEINKRIALYLEDECPKGKDGGNKWIKEFKPRVAVEPVRNCTRIPKEIQEEILRQVIKKLLEIRRPEVAKRGTEWNRGGLIEISELANGVEPDLLKKLRLECKGLQTLLKNNHQVFEVKQGRIQLRSANSLKVISETIKGNNNLKWKQKKCWFHANHPDGCPLEEIECSYSHDIR